MLFAIPSTMIGDVKDIVETIAVASAGVWFLVQWFMRRQLDAAIDFDVEITVIKRSPENGTCDVELAAVVKNATIVGAGIKRLTWLIISPDTHEPEKSWLPDAEETQILTRDTKWRLSELVTIPLNQLCRLEAVCEIDWQPSRQMIRYQRVFSTYPA